MQVRDVMVHEFESVSPQTPLQQANETMKALDLEPLPVVEDGRLVGMLTAAGVQDAASRLGLAAAGATVRDAMTPHVFSCYEDQNIAEAARAQQEDPEARACRGVLVLDRSGQLVGIVASRALASGSDERPSVTGAVGASQPKVSFRQDPVDHMSEESFPASDPPAPPSELGPER